MKLYKNSLCMRILMLLCIVMIMPLSAEISQVQYEANQQTFNNLVTVEKKGAIKRLFTSKKEKAVKSYYITQLKALAALMIDGAIMRADNQLGKSFGTTDNKIQVLIKASDQNTKNAYQYAAMNFYNQQKLNQTRLSGVLEEQAKGKKMSDFRAQMKTPDFKKQIIDAELDELNPYYTQVIKALNALGASIKFPDKLSLQSLEQFAQKK